MLLLHLTHPDPDAPGMAGAACTIAVDDDDRTVLMGLGIHDGAELIGATDYVNGPITLHPDDMVLTDDGAEQEHVYGKYLVFHAGDERIHPTRPVDMCRRVDGEVHTVTMGLEDDPRAAIASILAMAAAADIVEYLRGVRRRADEDPS